MRAIHLLMSAALCFALAIGVAGAETASTAAVITDFATQKSEIIKKLNDGSSYAEISENDRREVLQALDRMEQILAGRSVEALSEAQRVALFNNQELVTVLLTRAEYDSQVVCSRGRTVGTHFRTTRCETLAQRRHRHTLTDETVQRLQRGMQLEPGR